MTWFNPRTTPVTVMASMVANGNPDGQALVLKGVDPETCMIVFRNHWSQVNVPRTKSINLFLSPSVRLVELLESTHLH